MWDAGGLLSPTIPSHQTDAGGYTERRYTPIELLELLVLAELRRRGFSIHQLHQLQHILRESLSDLGRIFVGEVTNWKDVGRAPARHRALRPGEQLRHVRLFQGACSGEQRLRPEHAKLGGTAAVANAVKGDPFGIGYGGIAYLEGIKALRIAKTTKPPYCPFARRLRRTAVTLQ